DLVQSYAKELEGIKIVSGILNDPRNLTKKARGAIETGAISPKDINTLFHEFRGFVREKKSEVHEYGMSYAIGDIEGNLAPVDNALTKIMEDLTLIEIARKVVIDGASFLPEASLITSGILNDPRNLTNKARGAIETDTIRPSDLNKLFREFRDFVEEKKREVLEYRMRHARGGVKGNLAEVNDAFNKITNDFARIESARQKTQNITASVIVKGILNDKRNLANKARGAIETSAISRDDLYNLFHELQGFVSEKKGVVTEYERSHEPGDDSSNLVLVNKALKKITEDFDLISQLWQTSEATETSSPVIKETTGTKRHPHVDHVQLYDDAATIRPWFNPDWTEEEAEEMIYMNLSTGKVFPNKQAAERHFNELVKDGKQVWGFYVLVDSGDWTGMKKNVLFFGEREEKSSSPIEDGDTFKTSVAEFAKEIVAAPLNSKERANIENGTISSDDLDKIHDRLLKISRKLLRVPITDIMYDEYRDGIDEVPTSLTGAYKEIAENLYFVGKARQKMQDTAASPVVASYSYADLPTGLPTEVKKAHESAVERGEPVIVNIIGSWDIGFPTNFSDAEIVDEILEEINKLENANQYQYKFTRNYPGNEVIIKRIASSPIIDEGDKPLGGINLNSALLDLQIKRDGNG
ncbi:MAG: hypothetical protein KAS66_15785, partial [Candidatus Omnitrophica bacterium]|nr:hypothetical protein [Candidatus Omnitrophota bacterium]